MTGDDPKQLTVAIVRAKMRDRKSGLSGPILQYVDRDTRFDSLGFDAIDILETVLAIEQELGRALPQECETAETVGEVIDLANAGYIK